MGEGSRWIFPLTGRTATLEEVRKYDGKFKLKLDKPVKFGRRFESSIVVTPGSNVVPLC